MNQLLVFDDGGGRWGPLTDRRAAFELRTGSATTLERIERVTGLQADALMTPRRLEPVVVGRYSSIKVNHPPDQGRWLLVNGRCSQEGRLHDAAQLPPNTASMQEDGQVVAALLDAPAAAVFCSGGYQQIPDGVSIRRTPGRVLLARPWHILDELETTLRDDLLASGVDEWDLRRKDTTAFGDHQLRVAGDAQIQPRVVFNVEQGPVVVDHQALIGAMVMLEGPCYIGKRSHVACHAHIRPNTVIGPGCKVGGEVSYSIIQSHSYKAHHGYLGGSLVGQWVNLGAGTTVSNLKNTFGQVRTQLEPNVDPETTGRVYQGPIIGDFVRTAIGTRLLTGSCVGTGSMIALSALVPKFVDRFRFVTDAGNVPHDFKKLIVTVRQMMRPRQETLSESDEALLRQLYQHAATATQ